MPLYSPDHIILISVQLHKCDVPEDILITTFNLSEDDFDLIDFLANEF